MLILLFLLLAVCVLTDLRSRKILNIVTFPGMLLGLLCNVLMTHSWSGVLNSFSGIILGILIFFIPFAIGGLGAGDLKMLAVVGSFLGLQGVVWAGIWSAIAGGILSLALVLRAPQRFHRTTRYFKNLFFALLHQLPLPKPDTKGKQQRTFPYSLAILLGTICALILPKPF